MKRQSQTVKKRKLQTRCIFSEPFKEKIVQEINDGLYSIAEVIPIAIRIERQELMGNYVKVQQISIVSLKQ